MFAINPGIGESLESWYVENTVLLRVGQSYKAGKLLIVGGRQVDERPVDHV